VAHGVAVALLAALGDLSRFRDGDHAASNLGLVPPTRQSGRNCRHGPITKAGCGLTRSMLVQAAQHAASHPGPVGAFFRRLRKKKSRSVAIVATARKLVTIAFLMLKNNEPYRYAKPQTVKAKLSEARRKAGRKAAPAGDQLGALNEVHRKEGLPAASTPEQVSLGERRALEEAEVAAFAEEVHRPRERARPARRAGKEPQEQAEQTRERREPAR
jgi:hypothetical protein